jgi:hypothetical protein
MSSNHGTLLVAIIFFDQRRIEDFINLQISLIASTYVDSGLQFGLLSALLLRPQILRVLSRMAFHSLSFFSSLEQITSHDAVDPIPQHRARTTLCLIALKANGFF